MGYLEYVEEMEYSSSIRFIIGRDELYQLHEGSADTERLITAILRTYCGVFSDNVYIDERLLNKITGISRHRIYEILVTLAQRRIIHYKPSKKTPLITFSRQRVLPEELRFGREVYDERKEAFEKRITAMMEYARSTDKCRSSILLGYFGEKETNDCTTCDVCVSNRNSTRSRQAAEALILKALADGQPHDPSEIEALHLPKQLMTATIRRLADEEKIVTDNGKIRLDTR
jgi:ATP-dependent DNA helicase RecQ